MTREGPDICHVAVLSKSLPGKVRFTTTQEHPMGKETKDQHHIIGGVDTHKDLHVAAVVDAIAHDD